MLGMAASMLLLSGCRERLGCDAAIVNRSNETLQDVTFVVDGRTMRAGWLSGGAQAGFISVIYDEPHQAKVTWRTESGAPHGSQLLLPPAGSCADSHLTLWFKIQGPNQVTASWEESPR